MLKQLYLSNFQSHKSTTLDFHKGINVIVGSSDTGKSAILRSIYWNWYNRPGGEGFISFWNKDKKNKLKQPTSVTVTKANGELVRERSNDINGYRLNGEVFKALNGAVPDQIQDFLGIADLNFQKQLDQHFLLSSTSGEVAKFFNKIANLEKIDEAFRIVDSRKRKSVADEKALSSHIQDLKSKLLKFEGLDVAMKAFKKASAKNEEIQEHIEKRGLLEDYVTDYKEHRETLLACGKYLALERLIAKVDEAREKFEAVGEDKDRLVELLQQYDIFSKELRRANKYIKMEGLVNEVQVKEQSLASTSRIVNVLRKTILEYKSVSATVTSIPVEELDALTSKAVDVYSKYQDVKEAVSKLEKSISQYTTNEKMYRELNKEIKKLNKNLSEIPNVCEKCGQEIKG